MIKDTINAYYNLTKPGIIKGNLLSFIAGYFLAANTGDFNFVQISVGMVATCLVIGSACVLNNIFDSRIDSQMQRTKNREIPLGLISVKKALLYSAVLFTAGEYLLIAYINTLTALLGVIAVILYAFIYTLSKRHTVYSTEIGSISGAIPILAGYTALTGKIDLVGIVLFAVMVFWQMPHFYAIALRRIDDYKAAKLPIIPIKKGVKHTRFKSIVYLYFYILSLISLAIVADLGVLYILICLPYAIYWARRSTRNINNSLFWTSKMFTMSLKSLTLFCFALILETTF